MNLWLILLSVGSGGNYRCEEGAKFTFTSLWVQVSHEAECVLRRDVRRYTEGVAQEERNNGNEVG